MQLQHILGRQIHNPLKKLNSIFLHHKAKDFRCVPEFVNSGLALYYHMFYHPRISLVTFVHPRQIETQLHFNPPTLFLGCTLESVNLLNPPT
jgi:hypothetical protein